MIPFDLTGHEKKLKAAMSPLQERVLSGRCSTFENYKHCTGKLAGLQMALDLVQETIKKMNDE